MTAEVLVLLGWAGMEAATGKARGVQVLLPTEATAGRVPRVPV